MVRFFILLNTCTDGAGTRVNVFVEDEVTFVHLTDVNVFTEQLLSVTGTQLPNQREKSLILLTKVVSNCHLSFICYES